MRLTLLLPLLLVALSARAQGVADWAPADTAGSFIFRGGDLAVDWLAEVEARFKGDADIEAALARVRAFAYRGINPAVGKWGEGLDLSKGVAIYLVGPKQARAVIGVTDAAKAKATLVKYAGLLDAPVEATPEGFKLDDLVVHCAHRAPFLVCDTQAVPEVAPGRPAFLQDDGAVIYLDARGALMEELRRELDGAPVDAMRLAWLREAHGGRLTATVEMNPAAAGFLKPFGPGAVPHGALDAIDARTGALLKLSFDADRLFAFADQQMGSPPPPFKPLWDAIKANLSGDLSVSFAGGLLHPIFAIGLKPGGKLEPIIDEILPLLNQEIGPEGVTLTRKADQLTLQIGPNADLPEPILVNLAYGSTASSFVLALTGADVARVERGFTQAPIIPAPLAGKGRHGFVLWNIPAFFPGGALPDLFEGPAKYKALSDLQTLISIDWMSLEQVGLAGGVDGARISADLWWGRLGYDSDESRLYDQAILTDLRGQALESEALLLKLASEHANTPHGRLALRRLTGGGSIGVFPILGVLSAVAIPAFVKFTQRSKASEAHMNVRRMFDSAVYYYEEEHVDAEGNILPKSFPKSTTLTPKAPNCVNGNLVKQMPDSEVWQEEGWKQLNFELYEPSYYQYQFISEGEGKAAKFTARAIGDIDCDGVYSTFERVGTIDEFGNIISDGILVENELE
ncbi:hypothetical protein KKF91_13480 [Myxococcota bacterium]|nr:hypothetical protein [Myxococcota bacterium]